MRKHTLTALFAILLCFGACKHEPLPAEPETPSVEMEDVFFSASVADDQTKVDFEYNSGFYMKWHGDEQLHVFIKKSNGTIEQPEAGIIDCIPKTLSPDHFSLDFAGSVRARQNPETDKFVFMYAGLGSVVVGSTEKLVYNYDFTKQTIDASDEGLGSLRTCCPIIFENDGSNLAVTKKACVIKLIATGLPVNAKVTSVNFYSDSETFPKVVDVATFEFAATNLSHTLSYAIENASTDNSGAVTLYLAAPLVQGDKNYTITVVCEKNGEYVAKQATSGITGTSALSVSKLYNLRRGEWAGGINPGTVVGDPGDKMESIVGQWDKTGYLSNDVYGVLEKGKPQYLSLMHNAIINATQKAYRRSSWTSDTFVHPAAVRAAGKQGQPEETGQTLATNGPQYVEVTGSYTSAEDLTFNNIRLKKATKLYMTFVDSQAYNTNTVGYYCYPTAQEAIYKTMNGHDKIHEMVVFPSTSQDLRDPTVTHKFAAKTTAELLYPEYNGEFELTGALTQTFAAGTTVGFFGYTNGLDNTKDFAIKPISEMTDPAAGGVHYTNIAWNRRNVFDPQPYWNQISVLRVIMTGESEPRTDCVILAMKDKYVAHGYSGAATWTNPIILIYASEPDAIDFETSKDFWTSSVDLNEIKFGISYDLDAVTSTNKSTVFDGNTGYTTTLTVANTEFGGFSTLQITAGGVDITERVVEYNVEKTSATVRITREDAAGDITIKAHASKKIMVQSLSAADLMDLARETGDLPTYRLILHCSTNSAGNVAFGLNGNGSYCRLPADCPFADRFYAEPTQVKVADQYNDFEWSLEKAVDGSGNFIGFKLKKVTKISDTEVTVDGYITRGSDRYVRLTNSGTVLTTEAMNSTFEMKLKSPDSSYQYMTCAIGSTLKNAAFWEGGHVNLYGIWRVYKVWLQDAPAGN